MEIKFESPILDPNTRSEFPGSSISPITPPKKPFWGNRIFWAIAILVIFTIAMVTVALLRTKKTATPKSDRVTVTIQGPERLASGNEAQYIIVYSNGEGADLTNLSLEVFYPINFKFSSAEPQSSSSSGQLFTLPVLRQGQQAEIKVRGKLTGKVDERKDIKARLHYQLSNFNSEFTSEGSFATTLTAPNLNLEITGPIEVTNGQDTTFTVNYTNVSGQDLDNTALHVNYPTGFTFTAANPAPSKDNNIWNLGKLAVGASGKIDIKGSFTGDPSQEKLVSAEFGQIISNSFASQITTSVAFKVVSSSLTLTQTANPSDFTQLGQNIAYTLNYGNFGTKGLTNAVITVTLEGAAIDFTQMHVDKAIVTGNTLTWKSATLKELALISPNQKGTINFSVPLKSSLTTNIKNQTVKGKATIFTDQNDSSLKAADLEVKLASQLGIFVSGKVVSGPYPMQLGQPTVYSITILVTNFSNDLSGTEVIASLPLPESAWKSVVTPDSEKNNLTFDRNASKIRWKLGNVAAFSGKFTPARNVTFQIEINPTTNEQANNSVLLRDVKATGTDTFINKDIESTNLSEFRTTDIDE